MRSSLNSPLTISKHILFNNTPQLSDFHFKRRPTWLTYTIHIGGAATNSTALIRFCRSLDILKIHMHNRNKRLHVNILRQSQQPYVNLRALYDKATSYPQTSIHKNRCNNTKASQAAHNISFPTKHIRIKTSTTPPHNPSSPTTWQITRRILLRPSQITIIARLTSGTE